MAQNLLLDFRSSSMRSTELIFTEVKKLFFTFNCIPSNKKVKIEWGAFAEEARQWLQLTLSPTLETSYEELKEDLSVAFPGMELKWIIECELDGKFQHYQESGFNFRIRKLDLINKLNLILNYASKVDLTVA